MNTMTFSIRNDKDETATQLTMQINGDRTWPHILEEFVCFLRGAGFIITDEMIADQYADFLVTTGDGCDDSDFRTIT